MLWIRHGAFCMHQNWDVGLATGVKGAFLGFPNTLSSLELGAVGLQKTTAGNFIFPQSWATEGILFIVSVSRFK